MNGGRRLSSQEIAEALRERIRGGDLKAGDRLPTQAELAEEFGVERGTVRQALRALQEDGLLTNVSKGSPPRIAEPATPRAEPQPTMVALGPRLAQAFAAPRVRIDVVCHTSETLMLALSEPLRLIHEGRIRPESIDFRVLMPSRDIALAFPVLVEDEEDDPVHQRWLQMRNAQARVLRHNLHAVRSTHRIDVRIAFRALPFTPTSKLYLLNGEEALFGYYMVTRREEEYESRTLEIVRGGITEVVRRPLGNHHHGHDTLLVTSDTDQTEPVNGRAGWAGQWEGLRDLVVGARVVLWDFDGPVCRLFAGYTADRVAGELVDWLERLGLKELLTQEEQVHPDPHVLLAAVNRRHRQSDLVAEFEERLTREELRAVPTAWPTPYADALIRTWSALGVGLAVTTNNSPRAVSEYLATRDLLGCYRALSAMGVAPARALMVGDSASDVTAAREAGVPFLGYGHNERKTKILKQAGADTVVDSLEPVLRLLWEEGTPAPA